MPRGFQYGGLKLIGEVIAVALIDERRDGVLRLAEPALIRNYPSVEEHDSSSPR
ncbi:hypothetical protein KCP69_12010 [Salmonella enterica subsp. enterica]|nr:hypothetical protein KCP69_12010 [Salmonella enterica subsp. enterica]